MLIPNIIEKNYNGERIYDIYSKLLNNRIIFLNGEIILFSLITLERSKPIYFFSFKQSSYGRGVHPQGKSIIVSKLFDSI